MRGIVCHKFRHWINKENFWISYKFTCWGKKSIFRNSIFSLNLVIWSWSCHWLFGSFWYCLHAYLTENVLEKKLLCPQIILKIENVYFNVKLRENNVIGPYLILLGTVAATQIQAHVGQRQLCTQTINRQYAWRDQLVEEAPYCKGNLLPSYQPKLSYLSAHVVNRLLQENRNSIQNV